MTLFGGVYRLLEDTRKQCVEIRNELTHLKPLFGGRVGYKRFSPQEIPSRYFQPEHVLSNLGRSYTNLKLYAAGEAGWREYHREMWQGRVPSFIYWIKPQSGELPHSTFQLDSIRFAGGHIADPVELSQYKIKTAGAVFIGLTAWASIVVGPPQPGNDFYEEVTVTLKPDHRRLKELIAQRKPIRDRYVVKAAVHAHRSKTSEAGLTQETIELECSENGLSMKELFPLDWLRQETRITATQNSASSRIRSYDLTLDNLLH